MPNLPDFPANPVLLVDGDIVAYRAAAAAEKTFYAVDHGVSIAYYDTAKDAKAAAAKDPQAIIWSRKEVQPESFAIQCLESTMDAIQKRFEDAQTIRVFLSGERNFRDAIWKTKKYKGNRTTERPKHLEAVRQALISRWAAVVSSNQEADDDIGIAAGPRTVVISTDKDLDQIEGWHYNWVNEELYHVSEADAEQYFWEQVISGDATDNIPGLPGWGPVKARAYLDETCNHQGVTSDDYLNAVLSLYITQGFTSHYMQEMIDLVRIKRESN